MKNSLLLPITIAITSIVIAIAVYVVTSQGYTPTTPITTSTTKITTVKKMLPVTIADHILGNPRAPIKIIEYTEFSCVYCARYQQTLSQIINDYGPTGDVAWVFREIPFTVNHTISLQITQAAECVAQTAGNDIFWKFVNILFDNQPIKKIKLGQYEYAANANPNKVASCINNGIPNKRIEAVSKNAKSIGVQNIPYTIIISPNGASFSFEGTPPYSYIQQHINDLLKQNSLTAKIQ